MKKFPDFDDTVLEHFIDEDNGIDLYNAYKLIHSFDHNGSILYVLADKYNNYLTVNESAFNRTENSRQILSIINFENKNIQIKFHSESYHLVEFNLLKNQFSITFSDKSSQNVINDLIQELDNKINEKNYFKYIDGTFLYKVKWNKTSYKWENF